MPVEVVDASAVAALLFDEPEAERIADRMRGQELVAPTILPYEVALVCRRKAAAAPDKREVLLRAHALLGRMGIRLVGVDHEATVRIALTEGWTPYDAAYLWLARALDAELITLDRGLRRAAARR